MAISLNCGKKIKIAAPFEPIPRVETLRQVQLFHVTPRTFASRNLYTLQAE